MIGTVRIDERLQFRVTKVVFKEGMIHVQCSSEGPVPDLPVDVYDVHVYGIDGTEILTVRQRVGWSGATDGVTMVWPINLRDVVAVGS